MLRALLHNMRPGRLTWATITAHEDPLLSMAFSRLSYLDTGAFWQLMREACDGGDWALPSEPPGGRSTWHFWPRLPVGEGGGHARHVEPDLVIAWEKALLVVEAKHHRVQDAWQWAEELRAVRRRFERYPDWFIAVGGRNPHQREEIVAEVRRDLGSDAPPCFWLCWKRLRASAVRLSEESQSFGAAAILRDVSDGLRAWGYGDRARLELGTLPAVAEGNRLSGSTATLRAWRV